MSNVVLKDDSWLQEKAMNDYLAMGPDRSVLGLFHRYSKDVADNATALVPSTSLKELTLWEEESHWRDLAYKYDKEEHKAWLERRKELLNTLYQTKDGLADDMLKLGREA